MRYGDVIYTTGPWPFGTWPVPYRDVKDVKVYRGVRDPNVHFNVPYKVRYFRDVRVITYLIKYVNVLKKLRKRT